MNALSIAVFVALVGATLAVTYATARRNRSAADHYVAGGRITGPQNGLAIAGDFISAASFLGVTGAIALTGFSGFYLAVFVPVAFVLALLLIAEPLRNLGRFTLSDVLATRFSGVGVRFTMASSAVVIGIVYLVAQLVGAALLVRILFDIPYWIALLIIGVLTMIYTFLGGMAATTWIQIIKTSLLLLVAAVLFVWVLVRFGFNPIEPFTRALSQFGEQYVGPARSSTLASFDQLSQTLGLVLGVLGLPHVMVRFLTVPGARDARVSAFTAIWVFFSFYLIVPILGYGAGLIVGPDAIKAKNPGGNLAVVQLAKSLGGGILVAITAAVAFVTILAATAGLVIATSGAIAHDLYGQVVRKGTLSPESEHRAARIATLTVALVGVVIAFATEKQNVAFLASLGMSIAAAANLPALALTIYWRRMTACAVVCGMVVGLGVSILVIVLSPVVLGDNAVLGFSNPALVAVPLALVTSIVTALATAPRGDEAQAADSVFARVRLQALGLSKPGAN